MGGAPLLNVRQPRTRIRDARRACAVSQGGARLTSLQSSFLQNSSAIFLWWCLRSAVSSRDFQLAELTIGSMACWVIPWVFNAARSTAAESCTSEKTMTSVCVCSSLSMLWVCFNKNGEDARTRRGTPGDPSSPCCFRADRRACFAAYNNS